MPSALETYPADMPWAVVRLKNQLYAIATQDMREIVRAPEAARVPGAPSYVRGVFDLRGRVMPVVDLRMRLGLGSVLEDTNAFCAMMQQREEDHRKWLAELQASLDQRRPFTLATDPHQCAFGKWYDGHRADNVWIAALLKKFDKPHRQIHGVAIEVERLKAEQQYTAAGSLIAGTRDGVLASMLSLFSALRELVREEQRELAVVLSHEGRLFAATVDAAQSIEKFPPGNIEALATDQCGDGLVRRHARTAKGNVILLIETGSLLAGGPVGSWS